MLFRSIANKYGAKCFAAGTAVHTKTGLKAIEEIELGDEVLSYDEETGTQGYKPVVRLYRNVTEEWYVIRVNGEELRCTAEHPFYVVGKGFVPARGIHSSDKVLQSDGKCGIIEAVEIERLTEPERTYNFEVAEYHTYYVGKGILTHNKCGYKVYDAKKIAEQYDITVEQFHKQVKPTLFKQVKPNYAVGRNPDIALSRVGNIAYQGVKGSKFSNGFQITGLNMFEVIKTLY